MPADVSRPSYAPDRPPPGPLVIVNVLNYGHFNVHVDMILAWARDRGLSAAVVGCRPGASPLRRVLADSGRLTLHAIEDICPGLDWDDFETAKIALGRGCRAIVAAIADRLRPWAVVLVNADEIFFNDAAVVGPDYGFAVPAYGIVTFGRRQAHFGLEDPYTWRLRDVVAGRRAFAGLWSIDELHVAADDPGERFLHYLPDPYRDFEALPSPGGDVAALTDFLAASAAPVVPILGKFDHRKGNLWTLRAVAAHPTARVVVLGQREVDPAEDAAIDAVLAQLTAAGRAFCRFGFVDQALFTTVLDCGLVPCLPLPYRNHAGSSGPQLLGFEYGIASLAPDFGLMAERIRQHSLGRVFRLGDYDDFAATLGEMLDAPRDYGPAIVAFMRTFGETPMAQALDAALLGMPGRAGRPIPVSPDAGERARQAVERRDLSGALAALGQALAEHPGDPTLTLLRLAVRTRLGLAREAVADCKACLRLGLTEEVLFFVGLVLAAWPSEAERGAAPSENYDAVLSWIVPCLPRGSVPEAQATLLMDAVWRLLDAGQLQDGLRLVRGLRRAFKDAPAVRLVWAHALLRQERFDAAAAVLGALPPAACERADCRLALAYARLGQGHLDEAEALLKGLLERAGQGLDLGKLPDYRFTLALVHLRRKDFDAAGTLLDGLLAAFPDHPEYRRTRGGVYAQQGNYAPAITCFRSLAEGGDASAYLNLSDCLRYAGRFDEAAEALETAYGRKVCSDELLAEKRARIDAARQSAAGNAKP